MAKPKDCSATKYKTRVDSVVLVKLQGNPTTGYRWMLQSATPAGVVDSVGYESKPVAPDLTGSGSIETWKFKANRKGRVRLVFVYQRPWEKQQPAQTKLVTIRVR